MPARMLLRLTCSRSATARSAGRRSPILRDPSRTQFQTYSTTFDLHVPCPFSPSSQRWLPMASTRVSGLRPVRHPAHPQRLHVGAVMQLQYGSIRRRFDMKQIGTSDALQDDSSPRIICHRDDLHIAQAQVFHVPQIQALARHHAKHVRLGILLLVLRRRTRRLFFRAASLMLNEDVVRSEVLNLMAFEAANDASEARIGI